MPQNAPSAPLPAAPQAEPAPNWRAWIWSAGILLIMVLAAAAALTLSTERRGVVRATAEAAGQSTQLLGTVVDQMIRDLDGLVAGLQLAAITDAGPLRDESWGWLEQRMRERSTVRGYILLDEAGIVQRSGHPGQIGRSHADRIHFQVQRDGTGAESRRFVSDPYVSPTTGYRMLLVSWALRDASGRFAGTFAVDLDTAVVESRLGRLVDPGYDVVALIKRDRVVLAAAGVPGTQRLDPAFRDAGLAFLVDEARQAGHETAVIRDATLFGIEASWVVQLQELDMLDGCVVLARNLDQVLAPWRRHVMATVIAGGILVIAILASATVLTVLLDRQSRALVAATSEALVDPLTGLYNRRMFFERAESELARAGRLGDELVLLMLDIDHFKAVNDRHGHAVGDAVLIAVGHCLKGQLRREDLLARIGGEEFAILVPRQSVAAALRQAARLRRAVERLTVETDEAATPPITVQVTVSIGMALVDTGPRGFARALAAADAALYRAKAAGRNRVMLAEAPGDEVRLALISA